MGGATNGMELRPYQQAAMAAVQAEWQAGRRKTLLVLPTGCGKTIVFCKLAEELVRQGQRVLILAHRGELLEQRRPSCKRARAWSVRWKKRKAAAWAAGAGWWWAPCRASPGPSGWSSLGLSTLARWWWTRRIIPYPTATSGCYGILPRPACWA